MDKKQKYKILFIAFGSSFLIGLTVYLILLMTSKSSNPAKVYLSIFVVVLSILISLFFIFLIRFINQVVLMKNLSEQDAYVFGKKMDFYNRNLFETKVTSLRSKRKNKHAYQAIIRFTTAPKSMVLVNTRRQASITYNSLVAEHLRSLFSKQQKKYVYAYDNAGYYIYIFGGTRFDVIDLVAKLSDDLYEIVEKNNLHLFTSPFFGIEEPKENQSVVECIENAILARNASENNFESITFYQSSLRNVTKKDDLEMLLKGLENQEFVVYYQPKFNLKEERFTSAEALIRWNSPQHGFLLPYQFIPKAEASGLTHELDTFVFTQVCKDIQDNMKRGRRVVPVSLNFSLFEFFHMNFLEFITKTLDEYHIPPNLIEIEILERTSQSNPFLAVSIIKKLKAKGIRVLMDDFGIGYSNIANLGRIPFDTIKIDKSYIDDIENDEKARNIVKCLIDLGKLNHLEVIAEGVDNVHQVNILKSQGCDTIQGYYYSKPIPSQDFAKLLKENKFERPMEDK